MHADSLLLNLAEIGSGAKKETVWAGRTEQGYRYRVAAWPPRVRTLSRTDQDRCVECL